MVNNKIKIKIAIRHRSHSPLYTGSARVRRGLTGSPKEASGMQQIVRRTINPKNLDQCPDAIYRNQHRDIVPLLTFAGFRI